VGGRRGTSGDHTASILAVDPRSGAVRQVGQLPQPLSDPAVLTDGGRATVIGGETAAGPQGEILRLSPRLG
jgi:hypothetical protein